MSETTTPDPIFDPFTRTMNRNLLKYAVQRAIFCPVTKDVLDVRRAVLVTVTVPGQTEATQVMTAKAWDERGDNARATVLAKYPDATFEVLDGRTLYGKGK